MRLLPDQQRVKTLLADTITLLCKNGLNYSSEFCIEALIGITVDQNQVFLVNINETIGKEFLGKHSSKNRKRKIVENGSGLVNGDHLSSNSGVSKNKNFRFSEDNYKLSQHNVPSPSKDEVFLIDDRKSSESKIVANKIQSDPPERDLPSDPCSIVPSPHNSEGDTEPKHNNNNHKNQESVQVKQEPDEIDQGNDSELAMQLLYGSEGDDDNNKSDLSNVEHQVTGPPVWPEPTLSFSSGLTLPTVIAPSQPGGGDEESPTHSNEDAGQVNLSQMMGRRRRSRLVHEGYKYHKNRQGPDPGKTYWRCSNRKCPGRIILYQGKITIRGQHNHPASLTEWPTNKYPEEVEDALIDPGPNNILPIVSSHIDNIKNMMQQQQCDSENAENNCVMKSSIGLVDSQIFEQKGDTMKQTDMSNDDKNNELQSERNIYNINSFDLGQPVFPSQIN